MTLNPPPDELPKLQPHPDTKGLYVAHSKNKRVGEISRLRESQFLVRGANGRLLSTECRSLSEAQRMLANQDS